MQRYKWPIYFFISVAFWNMVGAGLFGFMINPPIALYYMQGLNTTPVHSHTALFGVYGLLGIGLTLVRSFVGMHGGTVEARSAGPGQGSEFVVRLPAAAAPAGRLRRA